MHLACSGMRMCMCWCCPEPTLPVKPAQDASTNSNSLAHLVVVEGPKLPSIRHCEILYYFKMRLACTLVVRQNLMAPGPVGKSLLPGFGNAEAVLFTLRVRNATAACASSPVCSSSCRRDIFYISCRYTLGDTLYWVFGYG